jgi:hypothetical protein
MAIELKCYFLKRVEVTILEVLIMRFAKYALLAFVINMNCIAAQADWLSDENAPAYFDSPLKSGSPVPWGKDTSKEQGNVLTKINDALSRGAISAEKASEYKAQLNKVNDKEQWYKSYGKAIPQDLLQEDLKQLDGLSATIQSQTTVHPAPQPIDAMHADVHKLISRALAVKKISNLEAEQYYERLAELEADIESLKEDPAGSGAEQAAVSEALASLKGDVQKRF